MPAGADMTGSAGSAGVAVIGSGAWGTTLALLAAQRAASASPAPNDATVMLWEHRAARAEAMARERENRAFLPGHPFPECLGVSSDLAEAVAGRGIVVLVTPAQRVRENARLLAPLLAPGAVVVCASKGL
ncbi:MAG TPA: hypothetical protein VID73_00195, partial [Ktedonobacterales bacterium]